MMEAPAEIEGAMRARHNGIGGGNASGNVGAACRKDAVKPRVIYLAKAVLDGIGCRRFRPLDSLKKFYVVPIVGEQKMGEVEWAGVNGTFAHEGFDKRNRPPESLRL